MFPNYSFELERGLVVHLVVGIHVANVVVVDQVHVTKLFFLLYQRGGKPRGVTCVNLNSKSELIFTILIVISLKLVLECV
jgi:hypothetical protein